MLRALFLLILLASSALGQSSPPRYVALLSRSGEIAIRTGNAPRPFAVVRPGLYEKGWKLRQSAPADDAGTARIRALDAGAVVRVAIEASVEPGADSRTLRVRCTLTPDKPVAVASAHVAVALQARDWTRAKATLGAEEVIVGAEAGPARLLGGAPGPLTLSRQGVALAAVAGAQPVLLQDNRAFGGDEIELRFGPQSPDGRDWAAGQTETFELNLTLPGPVRLVREEPLTLAAGDDWIPLEDAAEVAAGSALDFSGFLGDAPAGRYGRVVVRPDGRFGFEKSPKTVRFWGVNLAYGANYLERDEADRLADRLARTGYNAVRLHHHDGALFDGDNLDRLDYLVAALKKRGIYVKTDLYVSRPVAGYDMDAFKAAVLLRGDAFENWKEFARRLLTHVNPHTGLAWKDDPALALLCVVNESNLTNVVGRLPAPLKADLDAAWVAWRKERSLPARPIPASLSDDAPGRELGAFLATLHARAFARMEAFLRKEIGTRALLTDLNGWSEAPAFQAARVALDFVDTHFYWDHPRFLDEPWRLPSAGENDGGSAVVSGGAGPLAVAMRRHYGKPFVVSEFNYAAPNATRFEGGLLMGAAAALQEWDGVFRFAWAHSREAAVAPRPLGYFDLASDPAALAAERAALLLFRRGDVRGAPQALVQIVPRDSLMERFDTAPDPGFPELTLVTRVGARIEDKGKPLPPARPSEVRVSGLDSAGALSTLLEANRLPEANKTNLTLESRQSETNEIFLDGGLGTLRVITPRTMGGFAPEAESLRFGKMTVAVENADAVVYVAALDGRTVVEGARLLLAHVTDVQNTNARFLSSDRRVLERWGELPHLARRGRASVALERARPPQAVELWRLDMAGRRVGPVPVQVQGRTLSFTLDTLGPDGKAGVYYEMVVRDPAPKPAPAPATRPAAKPTAKPAPRR